MRMVLVAGARPNFMKVAPVLWAAEERGIDVTLVHSGQHYDHNMSSVFFEDLGIREPDVNLGVGSGTQAEQTAAVMVEFEKVVRDTRVDLLTVVGDVNSTVACGLVASKCGIRVAHVEAGLRSRDWDMPEEINRVLTDRLSDFLFAPSQDGVDNLVQEGYRADQIHLVGNVMVDTLLANLERARERTIIADLGIEKGNYGLVTLHRPSNVDHPETLEEIARALNKIAASLPLIFPVHPRTKPMINKLNLHGSIKIIEPAGYLDFIALQDGARIVLTDSGGIQEETTMLGVPCLTLRENTERPITVHEGSNRVVGTDAETIVATAEEALAYTGTYRRPELWDGHAAERIVDTLLAVPLSERPRPTAQAAN